jgi:RNA polymerase sigma-32 factor
MKSKKTAKKAKSPRRKKSKTVAVEKVQAIPTPVQAEVLLDEEDTTTSSAAVALPEVQDTLASYLAQVSKYPLLTRDQEQEIAQRYKEYGDPKDAEILITSNLRFVVKVAAEYAKFGAKLIDLIQEGNMGLIHAVKEFNPYRGVRLITYAVWWIRGYIQDYLMKQYSMVKIGTSGG